MPNAALGRFLEISLYAPAIRESLAFYESLGFVQATVGETWPYPYAVITDGRLFIGLHGQVVRAPALTFVRPDVSHAVRELESRGVVFDEVHLGEDVFNRAVFSDPAGQVVNLWEARTFSPPQMESPAATTCGYFTEYAMPARETQVVCAFWESLGFVGMEEQLLPFARTELTSDHLDIAFYRTRTLRQPVLTFEDDHMRERLTRLRERGFNLSDEMPDTLDESLNAVLIAPEGTRLLLMQSAA